MTSENADPITTFLSEHQKPTTTQEQRRLKEVLRKRETYAKKKQLNWGTAADVYTRALDLERIERDN
jgi:hypothetical protein